MRIRLTPVLVSLAFLLLPATTAGAIVPTAPEPGAVGLAVPQSVNVGYATPVLVVPVGGPLTFYNYDFPAHNIVALDAFGSDAQPWCRFFDAGECPLFFSPLISFGSSTPVDGMELIVEGEQYTYYCTLHEWMTGTLIAAPATA